MFLMLIRFGNCKTRQEIRQKTHQKGRSFIRGKNKEHAQKKNGERDRSVGVGTWGDLIPESTSAKSQDRFGLQVPCVSDVWVGVGRSGECIQGRTRLHAVLFRKHRDNISHTSRICSFRSLKMRWNYFTHNYIWLPDSIPYMSTFTVGSSVKTVN